MASMKQMRKDALRTLELRRDGKLNEETGERKPSRLETAQAELDAANSAAERVEKRQVSARAALRKITAEIDAAEKIVEATAALAESDGDDSEADDESADVELDFDDEDGDADESDDETPEGPARVNGRFVKREAVEA